MNTFERRERSTWNHVIEHHPLDIVHVIEKLNALEIEGKPYIPTIVKEYRTLRARGDYRDEEQREYDENELEGRVAGSLWEWAAFHTIQDQVPKDTHEILSPLETAIWCNRIVNRQKVVRFPFFTYSLANNFPVFDGVVLPKDTQKGSILCLEYTAHTTTEKMQMKLQRFSKFQRMVPSDTPIVSLTFFVPLRTNKKQEIDLYLPKPGMIEEIRIHPKTLRQLTRQVIDMANNPTKQCQLEVPPRF